jgi:hypothetical protein
MCTDDIAIPVDPMGLASFFDDGAAIQLGGDAEPTVGSFC